MSSGEAWTGAQRYRVSPLTSEPRDSIVANRALFLPQTPMILPASSSTVNTTESTLAMVT